MPELPEVEYVKKTLEPYVTQRVIEEIEIHMPKMLKKENPSLFISHIKNGKVSELHRKGKYLIFDIENNGNLKHLVIHLGMTGALFIVSNREEIPEKYRTHAHIHFVLSSGYQLYYCDIRRFGKLLSMNHKDYLKFKPIQDLGPEPLETENFSHFIANIKKLNGNKLIKPILLDQHVVSGIGNIYASDILFESEIHPESKIGNLDDNLLKKIFDISGRVLKESIALGGSSFNDYLHPDGEKGSYQEHFRVYQRYLCPKCDRKLIKKPIDLRMTYYCEICQKKY